MPKEKILVVDDEPDVVDLCMRMLSLEGYQVKGAGSGQEAIEAARREHFDLLLADFKMPGMNGLKTYQAIKEFDPEVIGVTITGYGSLDIAIEALELGFDGFVVKPFTRNQLRAAITKALTKKRLERENVRLKALIPLFELSRTFMMTTDFDALLKQVVQTAVQETKADRASLMLLDEGEQELTIRASVGLPQEVLATARERVGEGVAGWVAKTREPLLVSDETQLDPQVREAMTRGEISAALCVPLLIKGRVIGVLNLSKVGESHPFTQGDLELISILCGQAAIAIENARLLAETQRAYEELKELDRLKSEFISVVSHELRTPLHSVQGFVKLILEGKVPDEGRQRECLTIVAEQTKHVSTLIDNLLDVSRMEAGRFEMERAPVSMAEVIKKVVLNLGSMAEDKDISLKVRIPETLPSVEGDEGRLEQVVTNLIHNAIKFTPQGGRVTVAAGMDRGHLWVEVTDTGCGIPTEALPKVFDRFYQVDSSTTRRAGGTGLGLYIAKQIVEAHGGTIEVESEVSHGSTFRFTLPLHSVHRTSSRRDARGGD